MLVNPYLSAGYDYAGMGAAPAPYHRESTLPVNPYYAGGYAPGMGEITTVLGGVIPGGLKDAKLASAIRYNSTAPDRVGYRLTGPIQQFKPSFVAKLVYVLQAKLFSKMKDVDGKLGPATKRAILAAGNAATPSRIANATTIQAIAEGKKPLAEANLTELLGALSLQDAPKKKPAGGGGGGGGGKTPVALRSGIQPKKAGLDMPLVLGVILLGAAGWYWWKENKK